jgi:hypothetical protein
MMLWSLLQIHGLMYLTSFLVLMYASIPIHYLPLYTSSVGFICYHKQYVGPITC